MVRHPAVYLPCRSWVGVLQLPAVAIRHRTDRTTVGPVLARPTLVEVSHEGFQLEVAVGKVWLLHCVERWWLAASSRDCGFLHGFGLLDLAVDLALRQAKFQLFFLQLSASAFHRCHRSDRSRSSVVAKFFNTRLSRNTASVTLARVVVNVLCTKRTRSCGCTTCVCRHGKTATSQDIHMC